MMRHFIISALLTLSGTLLAQDAAEEALLLNQELNFLQESTGQMATTTLPGAQITPATQRRAADNLEIIYFGEEGEDTVRTRTAAPRRRKTR